VIHKIHKHLKKITYADALIVGSVVALGIFSLSPPEQYALVEQSGILLPSAGGVYSQWKPKTGVVHATMVRETTCNGIADYNYTNVVGYRDSYGIDLASIPDGATITAVEVTPCASFNKTGNGSTAGSATLNVFYGYNDIQSADAGNYNLTGTTPVDLTPTTFNELSLVKGPLSKLEIGAVLSGGDRGVRLGRIAVVLSYIPLTPPSNLATKNVATSQNDLSWKDVSSTEDGFKIERSQNSQFEPLVQVATTSENKTSYRNTGLLADETYYYRIRAFNSGGSSGYSNTAYAITATVEPQSPSSLAATAASSSVILNWTQNSRNEEGFTIERWATGASFVEIAKTGIDETNYTDRNLSRGTYYYRVRAFNRIDDSGYSNTVSVTTP